MEETDRPFKGIWIPREIWINADLSIVEKVLLAEINSLDPGDGSWASNDHFAAFLGVTEKRVRNLLSGLKSRGLIDVSGKFDSRKIKVVLSEETQTSRNPGHSQTSRNPGSNVPKSGIERPEIRDIPTYIERKQEKTEENNPSQKKKGFPGMLEFYGIEVPGNLQNELFAKAWSRWVEYRKENKFPAWGKTTVESRLKQFSDWGLSDSVAALEESRLQGWQGVFAPKATAKKTAGKIDYTKGF